MKKKIIIITISIILVIIILLLIGRKLLAPEQILPVPSVTPVETPGVFPTGSDMTKLQVISTDPADKATNIARIQPISISFNRSEDFSRLDFLVSPKFEFNKSQKDNKLIIAPLTYMETGTLYTYSLYDKSDAENFRQTFTFTTTGPTPEFLPDTRPVEAIQAEEDFLRENHPDTYLKNKTPYSSSSFTITADYRPPPQDYFYFSISLTSPDQAAAKQDFLNWLKSLQLTDLQIQALDITYK